MRSIWKGSLTFGLVNIPVHMYTASHDKELKFVLLHKKDMSEIRYARFCRAEEKEIPWNEIVKGYEVQKGEFVVMEDEDFEKINLKKSQSIEIVNFINEKEIDSIYYMKPYYLEPDKNADKAYSLLREAMRKSKKVALAKYVLRNQEHLAIVKVHDDMIILNQLRYQSELLQTEALRIPPTSKVNEKEMGIAIQLIDHLTAKFTPEKYSDTYVNEIKDIIAKKAKGRSIHPKTEAPRGTKVQDIMSLLQASIAKEKKPKKKTRRAA